MHHVRQPKKENTLLGPRTADHANARGKHPWRKGAPLCWRDVKGALYHEALKRGQLRQVSTVSSS
ncbi:hypothetical protein M513_09851 [Trichuris suis]|uniref:Uncharacterized protein n=1 Tax=Trichuris suis TaxID=68888 RepID=A0A085LWF3_9BILA|nr:hypothetical protein M513_09851 [Trichuris suis]